MNVVQNIKKFEDTNYKEKKCVGMKIKMYLTDNINV